MKTEKTVEEIKVKKVQVVGVDRGGRWRGVICDSVIGYFEILSDSEDDSQ